jgi:hypothetical protein
MPTVKFRVRQGSLADWTAVNPVLSAGEPAYETDTKVFRIGDGVTAYLSLPKYVDKDAVEAQRVLAQTAATAAAADRAAIETALANLSPSLLAPVGIVGYFPAATTPSGWLRLDGAVISRASYAALWTFAQASGLLAGTEVGKGANQFGPGNGSTTFSLIDARGEFIRAADFARGVDASRVFGSAQGHQIQDHAHHASSDAQGNHIHSAWTDAQGAHVHDIRTATGASSGGYIGTANLPSGGPGTDQTESAGSHGHNVGIGAAGIHAHNITIGSISWGNVGAETRPRNLAWNLCIKY